MSVNGDDDIEDRLDDVESQLEEISQLLRQILAAPRPDEDDREAEDGAEDEDLWDEGRNSQRVSSFEEYRDARVRAANNTSDTPPFFATGSFDGTLEKVIGYSQLFRDGFENLDSTSSKLSTRKFQVFLREVFIIQSNEVFEGEFEEGDASRQDVIEMIRKVAPGPSFYGAAEDQNGNIIFDNSRSPLTMMSLYDTWWYASPTSVQVPGEVRQVSSSAVGSAPWSSLNLARPQTVEVHSGGQPIADFISFFAEKVAENDDLALDDDLTFLLRQ